MKTINIKLLKKFSVRDIKEMRDMKRQGIDPLIISKVFNCNITTIRWHTDDINSDYYLTNLE